MCQHLELQSLECARTHSDMLTNISIHATPMCGVTGTRCILHVWGDIPMYIRSPHVWGNLCIHGSSMCWETWLKSHNFKCCRTHFGIYQTRLGKHRVLRRHLRQQKLNANEVGAAVGIPFAEIQFPLLRGDFVNSPADWDQIGTDNTYR